MKTLELISGIFNTDVENANIIFLLTLIAICCLLLATLMEKDGFLSKIEYRIIWISGLFSFLAQFWSIVKVDMSHAWGAGVFPTIIIAFGAFSASMFLRWRYSYSQGWRVAGRLIWIVVGIGAPAALLTIVFMTTGPHTLPLFIELLLSW